MNDKHKLCMYVHIMPPIHPFDLVSWSDLPVWMYRLNQPALVFCPDVLLLCLSCGSVSIDRSCGCWHTKMSIYVSESNTPCSTHVLMCDWMTQHMQSIHIPNNMHTVLVHQDLVGLIERECLSEYDSPKHARLGGDCPLRLRHKGQLCRCEFVDDLRRQAR